MYDYTIHPDNNPKIFKTTCERIEKALPGLTKRKLLVDVDGTTIQTYSQNEKDVDVYDDYEVGAVYVKSEIDLNDIFA